MRKRVKTAKPRAKRLGVDCRIITGFFYYSLAQKAFDGVFHVPEGQRIPDLNKMVRIRHILPFHAPGADNSRRKT